MKNFFAKKAQKIIGGQIKSKWTKFRDYVLANPEEVRDKIINQISKALSGDLDEKSKQKAEDCIEVAELMTRNLINVADSECGRILIGGIVDIYAQHAARKKVSNFADKLKEFNDKLEAENAKHLAENDNKKTAKTYDKAVKKRLDAVMPK